MFYFVFSFYSLLISELAITMSQNQGDIQERIAAARREAESLKEKIRAKKESSADTSCKFLTRFLILMGSEMIII